jgi:PAS domain S-box-containing protein
LVVYAIGIAVSVVLLTAVAMPIVGWMASRPRWAAGHIAAHLSTLLVLRVTRSVAAAANCFIAIVFAQSLLQIGTSNGFSAFGLIAIPVAAAHLVGMRSLVAWTVTASATAYLAPIALAADPQIVQMGVAIGTITLAIGAASAIVESSRERAVREARDATANTQIHRERLRAFVEETFPVIAEVVNGKLVFVSERAAEMLGLSRAEIAASSGEILRAEDIASLAERVARAPSEPGRFEIRVRRADGRWIWLEVFAIPFGASSNDARWLFAGRDIDREVTERERIERTARLDGISTLAAGVAHDFNNLLMVISGFGAALPPSEAREQVLAAAASAGELTSQLLAFGRSGPTIDELIDPERELRALVPMIRSLLGEELNFSMQGSADGATSRISVGRFKQVVLNLVTNAREATPRGGHVTITLQRVELPAERATLLDLAAGPFVEIALQDDGHGMTEEVRQRAFDPFFSTKPTERGSGLGLASAHGIARRAGGTIAIESAPERGTIARIFLPDAQQPLLPREAEPAIATRAETHARIWLVEDDERIRRLLEDALATAGYSTRSFGDAKTALDALATEPPPTLLVSDVVMPGIRGTELAARLREASAQVRVLFLSGYSDVEVGDWRSGVAGVRFLSKPKRPTQVVEAVSELLAS